MFIYFLIVLVCVSLGAGQPRIDGYGDGFAHAWKGDFPYIAFVWYRTEKTYDLCTGTIISENWVLTSLQAISFSRGIATANQLQIYYGATAFFYLDLTPYLYVNVSEVLTKRSADLRNVRGEAGVALLKTATKFDLQNKYVGVAKILTYSPYGKVRGTVLGFGNSATDEVKTLSYYYNISYNYDCGDIRDDFVKEEYGNKYYFCPRGNGIAHLNWGDDGAPLLLGGNGNYAISGLVRDHKELKSGWILVYLRTVFYLDWIKKHVPDAQFVDEYSSE